MVDMNIASEVMSWKVFAMNDVDFVASKSEEEAKEYYEQFISREEIEEQFVGEADILAPIEIDTDELNTEELKIFSDIIELELEYAEIVECTMLDWLQMNLIMGQTEPFIVASTEY